MQPSYHSISAIATDPLYLISRSDSIAAEPTAVLALIRSRLSLDFPSDADPRAEPTNQVRDPLVPPGF